MLRLRYFTQVIAIALCLGLATATSLMFSGSTAELPCDYQDAVTAIHWKKGADPLTAVTVASFADGEYVGSDGDRVRMLHTRTLVIDSVSVEDEGKYHCVVQTLSDAVVLSTDLAVAVPPQEPYPTLVLVDPTPEPSTNASCQYVVQETIRVYMRCDVAGFRPSIQLEWRRNDVISAGSRVVYSNNTEGTLNASSSLEFTMGGTSVEVSCLASGESVPDDQEPRTTSAVICSTPFVEEGGGGMNAVTIVVIVLIVLVLVAALVGLVVWIRRLLQDTMVRSAYTKTVSADDDTPSTSRFSNYYHFCRLTCCPCLMRDELYDAETNKKSSRSKDQADKKPRAPSAALRARLQQNRKKQEGKTQADSERVQPAGQGENTPMLDDTAQASNQTSAVPVNNKPPGARPKTRPAEDAVIIRDPNQGAQSQRRDEEVAVGGQAETGF